VASLLSPPMMVLPLSSLFRPFVFFFSFLLLFSLNGGPPTSFARPLECRLFLALSHTKFPSVLLSSSGSLSFLLQSVGFNRVIEVSSRLSCPDPSWQVFTFLSPPSWVLALRQLCCSFPSYFSPSRPPFAALPLQKSRCPLSRRFLPLTPCPSFWPLIFPPPQLFRNLSRVVLLRRILWAGRS